MVVHETAHAEQLSPTARATGQLLTQVLRCKVLQSCVLGG